MAGTEMRQGPVTAAAAEADTDRPGTLPLLSLAGLALACALGVAFFLRAGVVDLGAFNLRHHAAPPASEQRAESAAATPSPARPSPYAGPFTGAPPLLSPNDPAVPDREPLAGLPGALERFGGAFTIRHPSYLPADVAPFTVNWQPDSDPDRRAQGLGELYTWFYSAEHGAVLVLAQGRGVGVWPLTAPDNRAGRLRLADGTEVIWVIGHPARITAETGILWQGTEVTLGVRPTDGDGWYLRSPIISLDEMLRIASSLQRIASSE